MRYDIDLKRMKKKIEKKSATMKIKEQFIL